MEPWGPPQNVIQEDTKDSVRKVWRETFQNIPGSPARCSATSLSKVLTGTKVWEHVGSQPGLSGIGSHNWPIRTPTHGPITPNTSAVMKKSICFVCQRRRKKLSGCFVQVSMSETLTEDLVPPAWTLANQCHHFLVKRSSWHHISWYNQMLLIVWRRCL